VGCWSQHKNKEDSTCNISCQVFTVLSNLCQIKVAANTGFNL
jgi:hypothetical protein